MVHDFYNARRKNVLAAAPNAAHRALAMLERDHPGRVLVVTQNVDDLHERAGSCNLLHLHGELLRGRCDNCAGTIGWRDDMNRASPCPACGVPGYLRPDVVWFGERPFHLDRIAVEIAACDLFLSIGTSGNVYPAAGFVADVRATGRAHTVELNLDPSDGHSLFAERHLGPASDIVPTYVRGLLAAG
jgi:NAD-dependent deacetylase